MKLSLMILFLLAVAEGTGNTFSIHEERTVPAAPPLYPEVHEFTVCPNVPTVVEDLTEQEALSFQWFPAVHLNNPLIANPVFQTDNLTDSIQSYAYLVLRGTSAETIIDTVIVHVKPRRTIQSTISDATICRGDSVLISLTGSLVYDFFPYDQVYILSQTGFYLSPDTGVFYTITGYDETQCPSWPISIEIRVTQPPDSLYFEEMPLQYCVLDTAIHLPFAYPPGGGYWSGAGLIGDSLFSPGLAGPGLHRISYSTTDVQCTFTFSRTVEVFPVPEIQWPELPNFCQADAPFNVTAYPAGGNLIGPGILSNQFVPALLAPGSYELLYPTLQL